MIYNRLQKTNHFSLIYAIAFLRQQMLLLPVLLLFYINNGLTVNDYFLFQGLASLLTVILEIPAGYAADKYSAKIILIFAFFMLLLRDTFWLCGYGYYIVLIGELFYAIFRVCFDSIASSYIYTILKKKNQTTDINKIYGYFNATMYLSTAVAALYGSYIFEVAGYKIVLIIELIFVLVALFFASILPSDSKISMIKVHKLKKLMERGKTKERIIKLSNTLKYIIKRKKLIIYMLFSGILVGLSNFFFWSFQPILKLSESPIIFFAVIVLINNIIRVLSSFFSEKINKKMGIIKLANYLYCIEASSLILIIPLCFYTDFKLSLLLIFFLCLCIGMQLIFTINHISRLHKIIFSPIRSSISSFNMMLSRLITSLLMISAKFILPYFSIPVILIGYILIFLIICGGYLLYEINHQE